MKETKVKKIAEHFRCSESDLRHEHGRGWIFKFKGREHYLARNYFELQCSPNWALRQLPGRDI